MYRLIGPLLLAAIVSLNLTACAGSTGWRFSVGVSPVTAISDTQTLAQQEADNGK